MADFRLDRLEHLRLLYPGVRTTQHHGDMLASDVNAVLIATPVSTHHSLAMQAQRAGTHALIEKPIAATLSTAVEIAETAEQLGPVAMVGHTFQYNPTVDVVRT